jgi:hypothetical protein
METPIIIAFFPPAQTKFPVMWMPMANLLPLVHLTEPLMTSLPTGNGKRRDCLAIFLIF